MTQVLYRFLTSRATRLLTAVVVTTILSACANLSAPGTGKPPAIDVLDSTGRFVANVSLANPDGGNRRKDSATGRFVLQRKPELLQLELSSPFGQTLARFRQANGRSYAWVASPSPRELEGSSLEALSTELLGWPVPVQTLATWVATLPLPDAPARLEALGLSIKQTNSAQRQSGSGLVSEVSDGQWTLSVQDWLGKEDAQPARLPRIILLRNAADSNAQVELRLIIESWE